MYVDCIADCSFHLNEGEVVLFTLENCAPCEIVKTKLRENGYVFTIVDLKKYNGVVGSEEKVLFAPTIVKKENGSIEFIF